MSETNPVSPLHQRMIEDMTARKLGPHTQRSHIYSCKRFAAWLKRSPNTATAEEVRRFQLHLIESGASIWPRAAPCPCPRCGARMIVIEVFARGCEPRRRPTPGRFDTS